MISLMYNYHRIPLRKSNNLKNVKKVIYNETHVLNLSLTIQIHLSSNKSSLTIHDSKLEKCLSKLDEKFKILYDHCLFYNYVKCVNVLIHIYIVYFLWERKFLVL